MSYTDDLLKELEARGALGKIRSVGNNTTSQNTSSTQKKKKKEYTEELLDILSQRASATGNTLELPTYGTIGMDTFKVKDDDIAPIKTVTKVEQEEDRTWFKKGAYEDKYQFGDFSKTFYGSTRDLKQNLWEGVLGIGEKAVDAGATLAGGVGKLLGADKFAEKTQRFVEKDIINEEKVAHFLIGDIASTGKFDIEKNSVLGEKTDALAQSAGQLGVTAALQAAGVPWWLTTGATSFGGEAEIAFNQGATYGEAVTSAAITAGAEILTEKISGGIKFGGKALDEGLTKELARKISNKTLRTMAKLGMDVVGEGSEEVISQVLSNLGSSLYKEEGVMDILLSEEAVDEYIESFIGGAVLGGGMTGAKVGVNAMEGKGRDVASGLTANEQQVIDNVYEGRVAEKEKSGKITEKEKRKIYDEVLSDLDRGGIDIDTIEEVLGGETYSNYKKLVDAEEKMQREYDELGKKEHYTLADDTRYRELGERLKYVREKGAKNELRKRLDEQVSSMVEGSRLSESFAERSRRGQTFEADLEQYDEKQRAIVQKAVDSGILNNTRRTHEFVDMVARIAADRGLSFDFTNNAKLKESGFAVEGKTVNGFVTKDGITVNIQSAKSLNSVVGHEIAHVLEGTELYAEMQRAVFQYAETKGDVADRRAVLEKLYKGVEGANIDAELTADLVGDYLFTDSDFINNLSANHRNVFQKIYDEIKYLLKVATAGSKEARELEKVKRAFEKAYREGNKKSNTSATGSEGSTNTVREDAAFDETVAQNEREVKYSITETTDGKIAAVVDNDILASIDTTSWDNTKKEAAKKAASEALKQFSGGIVVDGITRKVNRVSRNEYTRSNYTENLYNHAPDVFADKMRAAEVADDIVVAATNWTRDGGLKHPRTDNIVDFDHGTTLIVSGDAKYTAEVVVGITDKGEAVFYDVVDLKPATFDTKKAEPPTTATTQDAIGSIHGDSADGTVSQDGGNVKYSINEVTEDGLTMTYVRVPNQNTPNFGSTYGQNIEPAGEYMSMDTMQGSHKIDGYEYGTIQFKKPLVLEHINTGATGWKKTVSDMYGGLTGKKLSAALIKDGYDAIVTYDEYGYSEIVNLNGKKLDNPQSGAKYSLAADSEGRQLAPGVAKRFANSKVVDENGDLRVVYHGTTYGEFSVFSKEHGNVENDFGVGFYFSSSDADVSEHYDGGGPDFENKVARRAEQIEQEEDIDYEEAEQRAREELFRGGHKFEVYLNIENPAIVGKTTLFSQDEALEEYDEEDYDDYDDYIADVEQAVADKIESIVWDVERKTSAYSVDGLSDVLFEAYFEGGIGIEELKTKVNELYLEDENGNLIGNEVVRQIIESLGYDGIIDPTVSGKWNMDMEEGTTHYIAFRPEQIKAVTNETPTDNPDIHRSLSNKGDIAPTFGNYNVRGEDIALEGADIAPVRQDIAPATVSENATVQEAAYEEPLEEESPYAELDRLTEQAEELEQRMYAAMDAGDNEAAMEINADLVEAAVRITELEQQLDADVQDRLDSIEDADAPAVREAPYSESTDTVTLPRKTVQSITKEAREALGFSTRRSTEMRELVVKFSQGEIDSEVLYDEIAERFGSYTETDSDADVAEVKRELRATAINVSDEIKSSFADYTASVMRPNFGKIRFSKAKEAGGVDMVYDELSDKYPGFFPKTIIQPADQLQRIIEVANMDANMEQTRELDQAMLESVTDSIVRRVNEYRQEQRRVLSEQNAFAAFNSLMADADRYAPVLEEDIAPVREDVAPVAEPVQESAPAEAAKQPIKTVKERLTAKLHNLEAELTAMTRLREESRVSYDEEIARLQTDYYERQNKNTKAANNLLRRMERLRRIQSDIDADYEKRINDLERQAVKAREEARTGESTEAQGAMRRELHASILENIRARMAERGIDFDEMLRNAKDLSTLATVDNTPQRVMEKALGYKEGQALADLTVNQVAQHETEGIRWLSSYTDRKTGLLAQISKQYGIKPGSKESAAAQMYAEGFYVADNDDIIEYGDRELAKDFPDARVQANIKGLARDPRIRQIYDATLAMINESRARNAYPEIQKLDNYFLHFRAMDDTFSRLGIPFNPNDIRAKDLPTDLNGVTADLKPGQPYFASAMHRKGKRTSFDLLGGLEKYLTSAKGQIYHIDDIQTLRALRNHIAETYGQAHGLDGLDTMTEEEAAAQIEQVYDAHLSTFAKFLNEEANVIAGKTALIDRGLEGIIGRRGMTFFDTLNRQVGANMVGFNVSSSLTNFIAPVQAFAKTNKAAFVKGFAQTVANRIGSITGKTDGFAENNPTMIRRKGADRFYRTPWQKAGDIGYSLMGAVDSLSTEIIVRSKYNELVSKGMSAEQAVIEADKWASRLMGDRSLGQMPQLYNSKMAGLITKFQLEVRNQLDSQFYDTIQEAKVSAEDIQNKLKRNAKVAAQVTSTFVQLAVVQHLFGKAFEAVAGYNPAFDIIEAIIKAFGWDDEEESEDTVLDNLGQGLMSLAEDMPYSSVITDGGRIPISSALPITQLIKGEDKYGNEKSRWETIAETAPYYLLPGGYGQIKKTTQGLGMFDEDLPIAGSYTDSGNLRYPVEDTPLNRAQAAIFGQYASSNARDYFDNERQSLKKNQIQELVDVDIPIREYWDYREGLNDQETLADKFDYIAGLDLPIDKKNILINNVVDRKEAVDLAYYDDYANYEEFDFAVKNPEKYDFLQSAGVSVAEYQSFDDDTKDAYNWAYENPDKYTLSRAVTDDVAVYRQYTKALNEIKADKYADGRTVSGSRKTKVLDYLNNLDADYYTKIILFKMEYNADDTYNREIIEYLNGRNDISFEEEVTILKELGFTVTADGTVRW